MRLSLPRRRTVRRGLRLWHVWIVLPLTFVTALAIAAGVFLAGWDLLGARGLKPEHRIDSKTLFDLVKLSFGVVAGAGALVALVVAYRRQRVDEDGALREATRLHTERFTTAVAQLGDASAAVRLGGVYALAGLADDAPTRELRQTCIDVLCAYLRLPYLAESDLPAGDAEARHMHLALREVRHTVIRLIGNHLRVDPDHPHSWQGHDFDFTSVTFDGGGFYGARFSGGRVNFTGAEFCGGRISFNGAQFSHDSIILFNNARFSDGTVDFTGADFSSGTVYFTGAEFCGSTVRFNSTFSEGTVSVTHAVFSGGTVDFSSAWFLGGTVDFGGAEFSGGTVRFKGTRFSGGTVRFGPGMGLRQTVFSDGTVDFTRAAFCGGTVDFGEAVFSGGTHVFDSVFSAGTVNFSSTVFSGGMVNFNGAQFSHNGIAHFNNARFSGGTVDFSNAVGMTPSGLVPPRGTPVSVGVSLPPAWYPADS